MRITELRIENIGKIKLFQVHPDGQNVIIGGKNGAGKSTVMAAIEMLLEGKRAFPKMPVRSGEASGSIFAELEGGFIVERVIDSDGGTTLAVKSSSGAKYPSPQTLLDGFRGANTLDPLAFVSLSPKAQLEQLRRLVGLDFSELDATRQTFFDKRTEVNRNVDSAEASLRTMPIAENVPDEEVSSDELTAQIEEINKQAAYYDRVGQEWDSSCLLIERRGEEIEQLTAQIEAYRDEIAEAEARADRAAKWLENNSRPDSLALQERIAEVSELNRKVRDNNARRKLEDKAKSFAIESAKLTTAIAAIDLEKQRQLNGAAFPVADLSFSNDEIIFKGIPFSQASQAEKLRVSTAMAFAANPKLKVVLIRDGSLLDEDNLKLITDVAAEHGGHVWIERVGTGEECSVILEDGEIKQVREAKAA